MRPMPVSMSARLTAWVWDPSPDSTDARPTVAMPATHRAMPARCRRFRERRKKATENAAANSISAPRIIW